MQFEKIIQGSFNQSHLSFGTSAGKQCACCSLFSICFNKIRSPGYWNTEDLDFLVREGDNLYKSLRKDTYLMVPDLPQYVPMFESLVSVRYLENKFGFNSYSPISFLKPQNESSAYDGAIFFIKGLCISLIYQKRAIYLFDSHSRNNCGQPIPNGFSALIKFKRTKDVEQFIVSTYLNQSDYQVQYEMQFLIIENFRELAFPKISRA